MQPRMVHVRCRGGLTVKAGGGPSGDHARRFNLLREASDTLETEPSSGPATLTPKSGASCLWDQWTFLAGLRKTDVSAGDSLEQGKEEKHSSQIDLVWNPGCLVLAISVFSRN